MLKLATFALAAALLGPASTNAPAALSKVSGGEWSVSGVPGASSPVRQCVADVTSLALFEHRGRKCSRSIIASSGASMTVQYSCGAAGFGRSDIDVITPRSLRISTQGISGNLPFNYVLQARRIGDCAKSAISSAH